MTTTPDAVTTFKTAVAGLLQTISEAATALADELVASLAATTADATTVGDGSSSFGLASPSPTTPSTPLNEQPPSVLPDGTPAPLPETPLPDGTPLDDQKIDVASSDADAPSTEQTDVADTTPTEPGQPTALNPDGSPVSVPEAEPVASASSVASETSNASQGVTPASDVTTPGEPAPTATATSTPDNSTTSTDAAPPISDLGTNS